MLLLFLFFFYRQIFFSLPRPNRITMLLQRRKRKERNTHKKTNRNKKAIAWRVCTTQNYFVGVLVNFEPFPIRCFFSKFAQTYQQQFNVLYQHLAKNNTSQRFWVNTNAKITIFVKADKKAKVIFACWINNRMLLMLLLQLLFAWWRVVIIGDEKRYFSLDVRSNCSIRSSRRKHVLFMFFLSLHTFHERFFFASFFAAFSNSFHFNGYF